MGWEGTQKHSYIDTLSEREMERDEASHPFGDSDMNGDALVKGVLAL